MYSLLWTSFSWNAHFYKTHRLAGFSWNLSKPEWETWNNFKISMLGLRKNLSLSDLLISQAQAFCVVPGVLLEKQVVANGWKFLASSGPNSVLHGSGKEGRKKAGCWWSEFEFRLAWDWLDACRQAAKSSRAPCSHCVVETWTSWASAFLSGAKIGFQATVHPHALDFSSPSSCQPPSLAALGLSPCYNCQIVPQPTLAMSCKWQNVGLYFAIHNLLNLEKISEL